MPGPIDHSNPDVALLRELLNRRPKDISFNNQKMDPLDATGNPDLPSVPHPGGFRPDPIINGSPRLANAVNDIFRIAPEMRGRVNMVSTAPTPNRIGSLADAGIKMGNGTFSGIADYTTTLGEFEPKMREIWLRHDDMFPDNESLEKTLGHEFGHVAGPNSGANRAHGYLIPRDTDMDLIEMLSARVLKR